MSKDTISKAEFDAFRTKTVEVALKAAKDHGLCEVVQRTLCRAGFSDLLPPVYAVEVKYGPESSDSWVLSHLQNFSDVASARTAAKRFRAEAIREAKYEAAYRGNNAPSRVVYYFDGKTVNEIVAEVKESAERYLKTEAQLKREVDTTWPKVRVVERTWQPNGRTSKKAVETVA